MAQAPTVRTAIQRTGGERKRYANRRRRRDRGKRIRQGGRDKHRDGECHKQNETYTGQGRPEWRGWGRGRGRGTVPCCLANKTPR